MVKLFSVQIFFKNGNKVTSLKAAHELQSFGYFQKKSVKEFMDFTGKIIVERSSLGQRASVKEQDYLCHVYLSTDGLCGVAITDADYPQRVAFNMLNSLLDDFSKEFPKIKYETDSEQFDSKYTYTQCQDFLEKYQTPNEADPMLRVQTELDETKIIVYNTIEQVLQRGEKLDDLVAKSEGLSLQSRTFYKTAKKTNSCCSW